MEGKLETKTSVVVTGASSTGKTTLYYDLLRLTSMLACPPHMTREQRAGEVHGRDALFISEEEFVRNFHEGKYIEDSLEFARFNGAYYGSPIDWITRVRAGEQLCFVSPSTGIARKVKTEVQDKIVWVHLTASEEVRRARMLRRNPDMTEEELERRLHGGDSQGTADGCDLMIDTSSLTAEQVYAVVTRELTKEKEK